MNDFTDEEKIELGEFFLNYIESDEDNGGVWKYIVAVLPEDMISKLITRNYQVYYAILYNRNISFDFVKKHINRIIAHNPNGVHFIDKKGYVRRPPEFYDQVNDLIEQYRDLV